MARHESLRTVFPETLGVPHQQVLTLDAARPRLRVEPIQANDLAEALRSAAARGFDLAQEPPLRAHLFGSTRRPRLTRQERCTTPNPSMSCCCCCITSPATAPRWRRWRAISAAPMRRGAPARCRRTAVRWRRCRCSMPTTRCGSTTCWAQESDPRQPHCTAAGVLDRDARRPAGGDRAAGRPAAARDRQLPRRPGAAAARCRAACGAAGAGAGQRREPVHGAAGRTGGAAEPARRRRRHSDRQPGGGPHRHRARRHGRVLRQHPGAAHRHLGPSELRASCWRGCAPATSRPTATRSCRSSGWWRCSTRRARCRIIRCSR